MAEYAPGHETTGDIEPSGLKAKPRLSNGVNVVVIGATGATGRYLVAELLLAPEIACVTTVTRRRYEMPREYNDSFQVLNAAKDGRLVEHVVDLQGVSDERLREIFECAHSFFSCMGSSTGAAGSKERFIQIEMETPLRFARIAKEKGVKHTGIISGAYSNEKSFIFYLKVKGRTEAALRNIDFPFLSIWKPGTLGRKEVSISFTEKILGIFTHPLPTDDLARAMVQETLLIIRGMTTPSNPAMYLNPQIKQLNLERLNEIQNTNLTNKIPSAVPADLDKKNTAERNVEDKPICSDIKEASSEDRTYQPNSGVASEQLQDVIKHTNESESASVSTDNEISKES